VSRWWWLGGFREVFGSVDPLLWRENRRVKVLVANYGKRNGIATLHPNIYLCNPILHYFFFK
jgi:hypothetical protein